MARKDAERLAGSFWWGIGSSIDRHKINDALNQCGGSLTVVFSAQLSRPKKACTFGGMTLWTKWLDEHGGAHNVPRHALVISKGRSERYYTLVCNTTDSIRKLRSQNFNDQLFCNFPNGAKPGASQNTALLTGQLCGDHSNGRYKFGFTANLIDPCFVRMASPRLLTSQEQELIADWNGKDYHELVSRINGTTNIAH